MRQSLLTTAALLLTLGSTANAQLAKDVKSCKFLGNITTSYNWQEYCDPQECNGSYVYSDYWNQVTCENATKWGSVHSGWGKFNWSNADRTYNYCKQKGILFKFHALIWGSQFPGWIKSLSVDETKKAIVEWFDEVKKHYPDLQIIDVVNEAIYSGGNYHSPYKDAKIIQALGSLAEDRVQKQTGNRPSYNCTTNGYPNPNSYQWLAEAFRMARDRWPNAILIYNDYNTFQWQKNEFIQVVNGIKACGGPIDAAGNQAHDLNDMSGSAFKAALEEIHNKTQLPQYITEYDIAKKNDATFETRYKEQFPVMWEADYVAGVTLWGWVYGKTWVSDGGDGGASGLIRNCQKRSAFTWLENYMKTDKAKNVTSPLCVGQGGGGISADVTLSAEKVFIGDEVTITATAESKKGKITHIEIFADNERIVDKWVAPYVWTFTPEKAGKVTIKIVAHDDNDASSTESTTLTVWEPQRPYNQVAAAIPGKIEAEEFDFGGEGNAYHDNDEQNRNGGNRNEGVDMNNTAIGYTQKGEWIEYTVNVEKGGIYDINARVASGSDGSAFKLYLNDKAITGDMKVPNTGDWSVFTTVTEEGVKLEKGEQVLKLEITGDWVDMDYMEFTLTESGTEIVKSDAITIYPNPADKHIWVNGVENAELKLIDATGRIITTSPTTDLDIPENCKGIYSLQIITANNVIVKKIVIK